MRAAIIINPVSGRGPRGMPVPDRTALARRMAAVLDVELDVVVTERAGHGRQIAEACVGAGVDTVVAWGGDGTINEVAAALTGTNTHLGIVPAGSGDGFATALGVPRDPEQALRAALTGAPRRIDVGDANGRPFFNLAGIGFDARVARRFNQLTRRGGLPYLRIGLEEGLRYEPSQYAVKLDDVTREVTALVIVFANSQQYGNGAVIAPHARVDDGLLDAVIVDARPFLSQLWRARHLFVGRDRAIDGVVRQSIQKAVVESDVPIDLHVDGESVDAGHRVDVTIRPGALSIRLLPASAST